MRARDDWFAAVGVSNEVREDQVYLQIQMMIRFAHVIKEALSDKDSGP
jgi:hypothetical protein